MTLKFQEVANFGMFFHMICKLFVLFMFVYDKNKDMPLWIGSIHGRIQHSTVVIIADTLLSFSFRTHAPHFFPLLFVHVALVTIAGVDVDRTLFSSSGGSEVYQVLGLCPVLHILVCQFLWGSLSLVFFICSAYVGFIYHMHIITQCHCVEQGNQSLLLKYHVCYF